jgi:hypothetical protein
MIIMEKACKNCIHWQAGSGTGDRGDCHKIGGKEDYELTDELPHLYSGGYESTSDFETPPDFHCSLFEQTENAEKIAKIYDEVQEFLKAEGWTIE